VVGGCHDGRVVTLCLTGDVMTGRGVDQILPAAGDPRLWERYAASAREYVALAEAVSGPIPRPMNWSWPWGDALQVLAVLYRMHPGNVGCLTVAATFLLEDDALSRWARCHSGEGADADEAHSSFPREPVGQTLGAEISPSGPGPLR
jgi:hypothetical protein